MCLFISGSSGKYENSVTLTHGFHTSLSVCLSAHLTGKNILRKKTAAGQSVKCNWAPVKLQSSELTLVTCDRLSHQTSPYDIKKHTQQKYPSQLTLRSSVTASWGAGMVGGRGCCDWQGGWLRVGMADSPGQEGWSSPCLFPCFPQIFSSGCQHSVGFYNGELTF